MKQDYEDQSLLGFCALCALHQVYLSPDTVREECGIPYGPVDCQDIMRAADELFLNPQVLPSTGNGQPDQNTFPLLAINVMDHSSFVLTNHLESIKIIDNNGQMIDWPLHSMIPKLDHMQFQFLSLSPNVEQIKSQFSSRVQLLGKTIPLTMGGWVQILLGCVVLVLGLQWVRFLIKTEFGAYDKQWAIVFITLLIGLSCILVVWGLRKLINESWNVYNKTGNQLQPPINSKNVFRNWIGINGMLWLAILVSYTIWFTPVMGSMLLSLSVMAILIISFLKRKNQGRPDQFHSDHSGRTKSNRNEWYHWLLILGVGSLVLGSGSILLEYPTEDILLFTIIGGLTAISIWQISELISNRRYNGIYFIPGKEDMKGDSNIENWTSGNLIYKDKKLDQTIFIIPSNETTVCYGIDKRKMKLFLEILLANKTEPFCCLYANDLAITHSNRDIYKRKVLVTNPQYLNHSLPARDTIASDTKSEIRMRIFPDEVGFKIDALLQTTILEVAQANPTICVIDNLSDQLDPFHEMILLENIIDFRFGKTTIIICSKPDLISLGHHVIHVDSLLFKNLQS